MGVSRAGSFLEAPGGSMSPRLFPASRGRLRFLTRGPFLHLRCQQRLVRCFSCCIALTDSSAFPSHF